MLQINASISDEHQALLERAGHDVMSVSRDMTRRLALDVVSRIIDLNRVDTGRSRMGWTAILRDYGVPVDPGGGRPGVARQRGRQRSPAAIAAARAEGAAASRHTERQGVSDFTVTVENPVEYVPHLEQYDPFILPSVRQGVAHFRSELQDAMREIGRRT